MIFNSIMEALKSFFEYVIEEFNSSGQVRDSKGRFSKMGFNISQKVMKGGRF